MAHDEGASANEFWRIFSIKAETLRSLIIGGQLRVAFGEIERLVASCGYHFSFELTKQHDDAVLVLTPESNPSVAAEIDALLSQSPPIPKWRFYGRRLRKSLPDALTFVRHIYGVDVGRARFAVSDPENGRYHVTMHIDLPSHFTRDQGEGLVMTFLEHALGEQTVMSKVAGAHIGLAAPADQANLLSGEQLAALLPSAD
jgi:hypothetical protein